MGTDRAAEPGTAAEVRPGSAQAATTTTSAGPATAAALQAQRPRSSHGGYASAYQSLKERGAAGTPAAAPPAAARHPQRTVLVAGLAFSLREDFLTRPPVASMTVPEIQAEKHELKVRPFQGVGVGDNIPMPARSVLTPSCACLGCSTGRHTVCTHAHACDTMTLHRWSSRGGQMSSFPLCASTTSSDPAGGAEGGGQGVHSADGAQGNQSREGEPAGVVRQVLAPEARAHQGRPGGCPEVRGRGRGHVNICQLV